MPDPNLPPDVASMLDRILAMPPEDRKRADALLGNLGGAGLQQQLGAATSNYMPPPASPWGTPEAPQQGDKPSQPSSYIGMPETMAAGSGPTSVSSPYPNQAPPVNLRAEMERDMTDQYNTPQQELGLDYSSPAPGGSMEALYSRRGNARNPEADRPQRAPRSSNRRPAGSRVRGASGGARGARRGESDAEWDARTRPFLEAMKARWRREAGYPGERQFSDPNENTPPGQVYSYSSGGRR